MLVEQASNPQFLSNTYLVADGDGGPAFFVDAGGPVAGLIETAERLDLEPTHVLLTHHHFDHVSDVGALLARWPQLEVLISARERDALVAAAASGGGEWAQAAERMGTVEAGETLRFGALEVHPLHTPGHTAGMLAFLVGEPASGGGGGVPAPGGFTGEGAAVFTGDTLFRNSVGGVRAPGHSTYADLKDSIMGTLMELAPDTAVYPGHAEATTVAAEWESNPFIRIWRGVDAEGAEPCTALGEPATLVLLATDYDGGSKAWVRWPDGADDIVPGSRVERGG